MPKGLGVKSIFSVKAIFLKKGLALLAVFLLSLSGCLPREGANQAAETSIPVDQDTVRTSEAQLLLQSRTPAVATASTQGEPAVATPVYFTPTPNPSITPEPVPHLQFCSPLEGHSLADLQEIISFPYDPPPVGKDTGHHGVDFAYYRRGERLSILGVPVQSVLPGKVTTVNQNLVPYGFMVMVETLYDRLPEQVVEHLGIPPKQSLYLLYAHMNEPPLVEVGAEVECGQRLGYVGNTPEEWSSAPHLHFEARYGPAGSQFTGMQYYDTRSQIDQMEKYALWRMSGDYVLLDPVGLLVYGLAGMEN